MLVYPSGALVTKLKHAMQGTTQNRIWEEKLGPVLDQLPNDDGILIDIAMSGGEICFHHLLSSLRFTYFIVAFIFFDGL